MKRRVGWMLLGLAISLVTLRVLFVGGARDTTSGLVDPAIGFYTRNHNAAYGGIDRWAYYGMGKEALVRRLEKDGYACSSAPRSVASALNGIYEMACNKNVSWPLSRTLTIKASFEHGVRDLLVAASARSKLAAGDGAIAGIFRRMGWLEPENLQVKGFEVESVDTLLRLSIDALRNTNWLRECTGELSHESRCAEFATQRRVSGFPPLPQEPIAVRSAKDVVSAMELVHLMPPMSRGTEGAEDGLLVRLADGKMWADFVGKDLAGRELVVSVELDSEGGVPIRLVAKAGADSREIRLSGERRLANDATVLWLVPEAGAQNPRFAMWLTVPAVGEAKRLRWLAEAMPRIDPAFLPRMIKAVIANLALSDQTENLGLYPALRLIDQRAGALRLAHLESWLPMEQSRQFVRDAYANDPLTRAAWALAMCESGEPLAIDTNCWLNFSISDEEVTALLRREVAELQTLYQSLGSAHPVMRRLKRLEDALQLIDSK